jgi:RND family efflux transporter MFP subunit
VDVADAKLALAELTAKRWKNLEGTQAVSQQQVDVQAANARTEEAEAAAARHDMAQYAALENFRSIVAPFDGIVTARNINVGDYVSPGGGELSNKDDATELFSVSDVHKLRIFVSVPQDYIDILKKGVTADITLPQFPDKVFHANFLTDASALDKDSRTVTTELVMDNPGNQIWPGSYAQVHFSVPSDTNTLLVPENSIIFQEQGEQVAVVDSSNHIVLKKVQVGRNLGQDVEILSGLSPEDRVVNNPSAGLLNGEQARIEPATNGYNQVETATASEGQ